jgi:hypothetical protein
MSGSNSRLADMRVTQTGLRDAANSGAQLSNPNASAEELVDPRWAIASPAGETAGHAWSIAQTLAAELERVRLAHRVRRLERVVTALGHRRDDQARVRSIAPALSDAIDDFSRELAQLRAQLSAMPSTTTEPASPARIVRASSAPTTGPRKARP